MDNYFLESDRLGWRKWTNADSDLAFSLWGDPEVTKLFDSRSELTDEEVLARLEKEISTEGEFGVQYWPVFVRASGKFVGASGLRPYDLDRGIYEKGTHLIPAAWGHGLGTEAGLTVIKYAFETVGAKALFAGHNPKNAASARILQKQGFTYTHDEFYEPTGLNHPSYLLKAEEYFQRRTEAG